MIWLLQLCDFDMLPGLYGLVSGVPGERSLVVVLWHNMLRVDSTSLVAQIVYKIDLNILLIHSYYLNPSTGALFSFCSEDRIFYDFLLNAVSRVKIGNRRKIPIS